MAIIWTIFQPKSTRPCNKLLKTTNVERLISYLRYYRDFYNESLDKIVQNSKNPSSLSSVRHLSTIARINNNFTHANLVRRCSLHNEGNAEKNIKMHNVLLKEIKKTKDKVKEKVETIIEKENIYTIPNLLCVSRIILSPYLGFLIVNNEFHYALTFLVVASLTDLLDGWIARTWQSQSSKMGSFLDPMADKVLIGTLFLTLTYADLIPVALTGLIIIRDALLVTAGFVIRYKSLPHPRTLNRYFDVTHATVQLAPTFISKVNTGVQLALVGSTLAAPVFQYVGHPFLESLWYVTGATTILSGMSYVLSNNTYKYLRRKSER